MKLAYAYAEVKSHVKFVVRDEVGDKDKAFDEGKSWWEYQLTVFGDNVRITFEWILWGCIKNEAYELLEKLGVEWNRKETDENSFDAGGVYLYKDDKLVAEIAWYLEPR